MRPELIWRPSYGWPGGERWELWCGEKCFGKVIRWQRGEYDYEMFVGDEDSNETQCSSLRDGALKILQHVKEQNL